MSLNDLLGSLDEEQRKAVTLETNGVVAAGAGSGKTKVLASRYAWLVMEKNLKPEEILTLTFTNKAVSEMYSRIYRYLLDHADTKDAACPRGGTESGVSLSRERAASALRDFHKAKISTLDSFSAGIARTAASRYGISPDFTSDDAALRDLARNEALAFVLDHREDSAIRTLLVDHKIRVIAEEIFAATVLKYSPISSPPDLDKNLAAQKKLILEAWREKTGTVYDISGKIIDALTALAEQKKSINFTRALGDILLNSPPPEPPDITALFETRPAGTSPAAEADSDLFSAETRRRLKKYFDYYSALVAARLPGNYGDVYTPVVEYFRPLKGKDGGGLYFELESAANCALHFTLSAGLFDLVKEFRDAFNSRKRAAGFLSFNDIARLAVDALRDHPDIRKVYKDSFKMIMIDEFQDNNALQRDLIYLLAENPERTEKSIAPPEELEENRMFFVGDEKQSIYRFRGADVAVFRSLGKTLSGKRADGAVQLLHNYRSHPDLVAVFNHIFERVFLRAESGVPDYEALYNPVKPPEPSGENGGAGESGRAEIVGESAGGKERRNIVPADKIPGAKYPLASFCFLNGNDLPKDDSGGIKSHDLEAAFIAEKIRDMVAKKEKIPKRKDSKVEWAECSWGDFTVLERSYTHQSTLEKYFREFGIPYTTDRPSGLFNEAPVLDLRAYLRLLVYPEDRIAYATLIRSPFTRLGDLTLAVCMLSMNASDKDSGGKTPEPFDEENDALVPVEDLELYRRARERYRALREASRVIPVTELLTKLWFEEGYRFETLWPASAQVYESLFDLFFSLAGESDRRGKSLADFIEYLEDVMNREEKPDDRDIPGEGEAGVRIMSIHKSKGLEFPVVFIFDCAGAGNMGLSKEMLHYHEKYGLILNVPQAEELAVGGNYLLKIIAEEEKAKDTAELRRLLYVAMTRAESRLFLTFTLPGQNKDEKKEWDMEGEDFNEATLRRRLAQLDEKPEGRETFLSLLGGILADAPPSLRALETIPVLSRAEIAQRAARKRNTASAAEMAGHPGGGSFRNRREAALAAEAFYAEAEIIPEGKAGPVSLQASGLRFKPPRADVVPGREARDGAFEKDTLDTLFEKSGLGPADFGSIVHAVLEAALSGKPCVIPPEIRSRVDDEKKSGELLAAARGMADVFLASELGKRWAASSCRESEYPVITSANIETPGNTRSVAVMGQIDLLFEEEGEVVVADFKTGRIEKDEDHYGQLAAYYRAAGDIFGKPVSLWLCYLRSGRIVNVTEKVKALSLDEMAGEALADYSA